MKKLLLFFVMSGMASYLFAQVAISNGGGTLKDITPTGVTVTSEVAGKGDVGKKLTSIGKNLIFTAKDATNGEQVWVYNGTDAPSILKKIGTTGCDPNFLERSLDGTKVFFSATDSNGSELWVTDGTAGGTKMVQNLNPAGGSEPDMITAYKSGVLFRAKDVIAAGQGKSHLFYSDGNTITSVARVELRKEGDTMWKDIQVTYDGKKAFFVADDGTHGYEMWCYDGTAAQMVLDIGDTTDPDNAEDGSTVSTKIEWPIAINNVQCLFRAQTPATWLGTVAAGSLHDINEELWVTDGTADGTYLLGDWNKAVEDVTDQNGNVLYQRTKNTQYAYPVILKGMVMARADDGVHGVELCAFDNIPYADSKTKSRHVVDMNGVGSDGSNGATWTEGNAVWNGIWISFLNHDWPSETFDPANGSKIGMDMVVYDPKIAGKDAVYALCDFWGPDDGIQNGWGKPYPIGVNRRCYFPGQSGAGSSDQSMYYIETSTVDPTHTPKELFNGLGDQTRYVKANYDDKLAVVTKSAAGEGQPDIVKLYVYDDGLDKTNAIRDNGNGPADMVAYFKSPGNVKSKPSNESLTDITPAGVTITSEVAGKGDAGKKLISIGKNLIFTAKDATNGEQVWVYNGTDAPSILKKIGTTGCDPNFLERSLDGTKVFFSATDASGSELWVTDGTAGGTKMIQNLNPAGGSEPDMITAYKDGVLFRAKDVIAAGQGKSHLFYSDGNTIVNVARVELRKEGDTMWKDIQVTYDGKKAFFVSDDGVHGYEMWCYDGATAQMVLDIGDTTDPDNAEDGSTVSTKIEWPLAINNEQCLFRAQTPASWLGKVAAGTLHDINEELWVTDGTPDGTYLLGDWNKAVEDVTDQNGNVLYQRTKNTQFAYPVILKGMVMARADDGVHGVELCAFDNIPYTNSKTKSRHVVDMNGVGSDGSNGATWTEGNAVWNGIWISFLNHDWPSETFDPANGSKIGMDMVVYDPSIAGKDAVYALCDFWGPDDGIQNGWGKPYPIGVNRRCYFPGQSGAGSSDQSMYYIETMDVDPTHTPKELFNGPGDQTRYVKANYDDKLAVVTKSSAGEGQPDIVKLFIYDDGQDKTNAIKDNGNGPADMVAYFQSPGNVKSQPSNESMTDITPAGVTVTSEVAGKGNVGKKLTAVGDYLLFTAKDATHGEQVWVYNGMTSATAPAAILKSINGTIGCDPNFLERSLDGKKVFFSATDASGSELWVTDGTAGGTKMIQNLNPAGGSEPDMITAYMDGVLFRAKDVIAAGQGKSHLFYSDGNTVVNVARVELRKEGDTMWKDIQVSYDGKKAFFVADDGTHGYEMWCYDGTTAQMVLDIGDASDPDNAEDGSTVSTKIEWPLAINNVQCLFRAQTPAKWLGAAAAGTLHDINEELWVTDGTAKGTYLLGDWNKAVEDVTDQNGNVSYQRSKNTQFAYPVILKKMVMARADDGVHGVELCAFDNIPYSDSRSKSRHVVDMNGVGSDGSNGATWTEGNAVWNGIWISFLNHDWPSDSFDPANGSKIGMDMVVYDPSIAGKDAVYALCDFWGPDDGIQNGWGKPYPIGVNRRCYFPGQSGAGSSDQSMYYIETSTVDPTHTPKELFNGPGDQTRYVKENYNDRLAFVTKSAAGEGQPDIVKIYIYDDGQDKSNAIKDNGNGPSDMVPYFESPGNIKTSVTNLNQTNISVFPNPAMDHIVVRMDQERAQSRIVNSAGHVMWSGEIFNNKSIDVSSLSSGAYILLVNSKTGVTHTQIIITK